MQASAPQLHPDVPQNVVAHYRIRLGDMDAGWSQADVVVEGEYETTWQEHAYLQPEAGLGYIDDEGRVTVCRRRTVDARRSGTDLSCVGFAAGTGAGDLSGDWRGIWWT